MTTSFEIKTWYDNWYRIHGDNAMRSGKFYILLADKYFPLGSREKLLDVGCGNGYMRWCLDTNGYDVYGIDISSEAIRLTKELFPKIKEDDEHFKEAPAEHIPFLDEFFECVNCFGVLEHVSSIYFSLEEMYRVGTKDCKYLIAVPNSNFLYWKLIGKKGTIQQEINENCKSLKEWSRIFHAHNFKITKVDKDMWHADKYDNKSARLFWTILWKLLPLKFTYNFIFILEKV